MRLHHARHNRAALGIDNLVTTVLVAPAGPHLDDPVALDDDLARGGALPVPSKTNPLVKTVRAIG
ncbi:hypothetical protein [Paractinoplanes durhamensis]|uniref:hypothetical protein n=1 Tax=Paractinoplanes durhamensis TaxID=113563 RepID=UPI00363286DB